jgi:hypothetical protein
MWAEGTNAFTIRCEGHDIWDAADGFNFSYETKAGDFDMVVRQLSFTKVDNYSKGGLMVREDLTPASRQWDIVNYPTSADGIPAIDGSGNGQNTIDCQTRSANGLASLGWGTAPGTVPNYPNAWVRLKRTGQILQGYWSSNGVAWVQEGLVDISTNANGPLPASVYIGICCTSHQNDPVTAITPLYYYTASFADYNTSFVAPTNTGPATIKVGKTGNTVTITYTGTLQSSGTVNGTYSDVSGATSPYTVPVSASPEKFYRAH